MRLRNLFLILFTMSALVFSNFFLYSEWKGYNLNQNKSVNDVVDNNLSIGGIYVASQWGVPVSDTVLSCPNVDGVFLRLYWDHLQPEKDKYDWSFLDAELKRILNSGKKISFGVAAGSHSPLWIYDTGVQGLEFDEFRHQGKGKRFSVKIPVPWNETYLKLWMNFISDFAVHLKSDPAVYKNISLLKLSGMNESTIEIRLPAQKEISNEKGSGTDAPAIWLSAGYKPRLVLNAWNQILQCWQDNFKDKYVSMAVIPKKSFPAIDDSGHETNLIKNDDLTKQLISAGYEKFKDHFAVQWNALRNDAIIPELMTDGVKKNIVKGYQLAENDFADPDCLENNSCDQELFKSVLKKGLEEGNAVFIEIFPKDVSVFPKAIAYAHEKMRRQ